MAYNVAIKSSETAIRECLCKSKAFMRASVLTGLKWQQLFVKVNGVLRKCRRSRNGSLCHAIFLSPPLSMAVTNYLQNRAFTI